MKIYCPVGRPRLKGSGVGPYALAESCGPSSSDTSSYFDSLYPSLWVSGTWAGKILGGSVNGILRSGR